ncbi:MAG: hypothetical protein HYW01_06340 [Deltaproteobacteria bacterium]|nr:hypothetical protein [Deltaproteobacteria bacterium]
MPEVKREELKIRDITDAMKGVSVLVKENFLVGFDLTISLWEENLKVLSSQLDKWLSLQRDYINLMRDFSEKLPNEGMKMWSEGLKPLHAQTDWFTSLQRDYIRSTQNSSNKLTKDLLTLSQKSIDRTP